MSKKNTKSGGGLTPINGGKGRSSNGSGGNNGSNGHHGTTTPTTTTTPTNRDGDTTTPGATAGGNSKVIDLSTIRAQRNNDNRRTVERFFLQHMIDAYCEVGGGHQQLPIEIVEVSENGCSFRISPDKAKTLPRDGKGAIAPIAARLYFSRDSYLRIGLHVVNSTPEITSGGNTLRFGCRVDEAFASTEAYRQFVLFMEQFAKHCSRDSKQVSAF
jgi:hypothetical protein